MHALPSGCRQQLALLLKQMQHEKESWGGG
jgi:hypothetical protein